MDFNVTSANWLSSRFAAVFGARKIDKSKISQGDDVPVLNTRDLSRNMVVNVSSLAALQEFEGWSGYCSGKAGRELFHRRVALSDSGLYDIGSMQGCTHAPRLYTRMVLLKFRRRTAAISGALLAFDSPHTTIFSGEITHLPPQIVLHST